MRGVPEFVRDEILKLTSGILDSECDEHLLDKVTVVQGYLELLDRDPRNEQCYQRFCVALTDLLRTVHEQGLVDTANRLASLKDEF